MIKIMADTSILMSSYEAKEKGITIAPLSVTINGNTKSINNLCHYIVDGKRIIGKTNIERLFLFLTKFKERKVFFNKQLF